MESMVDQRDVSTIKRSIIEQAFDDLRNEIAELEQRVDDVIGVFSPALCEGYPTSDDSPKENETQENSAITQSTHGLTRRIRAINNRLSDLKLRSEL